MTIQIKPMYEMKLVAEIKDKLWSMPETSTYRSVQFYLEKWRKVYDSFGNANFDIYTKDGNIDLYATLHYIGDGELLLKIAIDLGIETPDFIPLIPEFRNVLKTSYKQAGETFEKAFKQVKSDPSASIIMAHSALESILKEIAKVLKIDKANTMTIKNLTKEVMKKFKDNPEFPNELKNISNNFENINQTIEDLRSKKTEAHGRTSDDIVVTTPLYAEFIVNSVATVGTFLINYYEQMMQTESENASDDDLPF